jgi:hypothetical protein
MLSSRVIATPPVPVLGEVPIAPAEARAAIQRLLAVTSAALEERAQLSHALQSRILVEQAKGVLAERLRVSVDVAFTLLRNAARSERMAIHRLAEVVLAQRETPVAIIAAAVELRQRPPRGGNRGGRSG